MCGCKAESSGCHAKRACQEVNANHVTWATADTLLMRVVEKHWQRIARSEVGRNGHRM
jgi:predicted oxidoreductase